MSDSSSSSITSASSLTDLTLAVRIDGVPEQEVFLQHGLSIGRNLSNTICVSEPEIERIHAMVCKQPDGSMMMECVADHLRLKMADNSEVHSIPLKPGTTFKLGKAVIRCLKRETKPTILVSDNPWEVRCPRCHETIADLPRDAKKCPRCNLQLQYHTSEPGVAGTGGPESFRSTSSFEGWLPNEVGPYRIRAFVAQGGMGIILRGLHGQSDLPAAVKLLKIIDDDDPSWRARFVAEIDTLKGLRHPNVVRLQDNGKDEKLMWLAMDWIDGKPLTKMIAEYREKQTPMPIEQIKEVLIQVITGLKYLHEKGIIHRDLKPSNILMAQDGLVKMVDFGIARATSGQTAVMTQLTQTGMVAGTESYMSPEQGEGQNITPASDIYSLGVMWYEMVVGRRPVGSFASPSLMRPDCPVAWSNLIAQTLAGDPRSRPNLDQILYVLNTMTAQPPPLPGNRNAPGGQVTGFNTTGFNAWPNQQGHMPPPPPPGGQTGFTNYHPPQPPPPGGQAGFTPGYRPEPPQYDPTIVTPQYNHGGGGGGGGGGGFMSKVAGFFKSTFNTISQQTPVLLAKMGPVGAWIKTHKGPAFGITGAIVVILIIVSIRSCGSSTPRSNIGGGAGGAGGGALGGGGAGGGGINNNNQNEFANEVAAAKVYEQAVAQMGRVTSIYDPAFKTAYDMMSQSAAMGNVPAMLYLANFHADQRYGNYYDMQRAIGYWQAAARKGNVPAKLILEQRRIPY